MSVTTTTPVGMLSYPHLFERQEPMEPGGEGKYAAAIVFEEGTDLSTLKAAVLAAAKEKFGAKAGELLKKNKLRMPLREDGEEKGYPENCIFFNARSTRKPTVVSRYADPETGKMRPITEPSEMYPGALVKFSVDVYGYDRAGNKGVAFGLNSVLKFGDGDRLDGRRTVESVFGDDVIKAEEVDLAAVGSDSDDDLTALM